MLPLKFKWRALARALSSLELTLVCLSLLMALTVICTLAQVPLGTYAAVEGTIRSFLVWWRPQGRSFSVPVFPGGGLVGLLLLINLVTAQFLRLEWSRRKAGLWLAHFGLALLFVGEFVTAYFQVESQLPIELGQTRNYSQDSRRLELAVIDQTDPAQDTLTSVPDSLLKEGARLAPASLPFTLSVRRYHENSLVHQRGPEEPPSEATLGFGPSLHVHEQAPTASEERENARAALVEISTPRGPLGTLWLSNALEEPQTLEHEGRRYALALRPRRYYLPFSLTLKEFRHDRYPGTNIPKNFSSLVRLSDPAGGEERDVLIYMNNPLRHAGKTFYQSSFGKNDTLSVFQVVRNPGWLIPYLSCALVALGMLLHFGLKLGGAIGESHKIKTT